MTTLIKIIVTSIFSLSLFSCNFDLGVRGNGNVITKERTLDNNFDHIEVSRGIDVYLTQNETESLTVQADENLQDLIITKVENNILKIYTAENISYDEAKKVRVSFKNVLEISATSGSTVYGTGIITADYLELEATSGADINLEVKVKSLHCKASSGGDLKISGTADILNATASSGSAIEAENLITVTANARTSTGAEIIVHASKD